MKESVCNTSRCSGDEEVGLLPAQLSAQLSVQLPAKRVLIACEMMEDEVKSALFQCEKESASAGSIFEAPSLVWVERGYHTHPDKLREELRRRIEEAEGSGYREILLAFGLCGNSALGLKTRCARLVIPKYDDCINMLLYTGSRKKRALCKAGVLYFTHGWTKGENSFTGQYDRYVLKYGNKRAKRLMDLMYGGYKRVSIIDTGCFDLEETAVYAKETAQVLKLDDDVVSGSNVVLKKLISGEYDQNFIIHEAGEEICEEDFRYN